MRDKGLLICLYYPLNFTRNDPRKNIIISVNNSWVLLSNYVTKHAIDIDGMYGMYDDLFRLSSDTTSPASFLDRHQRTCVGGVAHLQSFGRCGHLQASGHTSHRHVLRPGASMVVRWQ